MKHIIKLFMISSFFLSACSSMNVSVLAVYEKEINFKNKASTKLDSLFMNKDKMKPSGLYTGKESPGYTIKGKIINQDSISLGITMISFGKIDNEDNVIFENFRSNLDGNFTITNIDSGSYRFSVFKEDYEFKVIDKIKLTENNSPLELKLILTKQ